METGVKIKMKDNRKDMSTSIDADVKDLFQATCKINGHTMSEALEALMHIYISGEYVLVKQPPYVAVKKD